MSAQHCVRPERELAPGQSGAGFGERIPVRCFISDPGIASSLKSLCKTPRAATGWKASNPRCLGDAIEALSR